MDNPRSQSKIFYGWYIVAIAFAANFLSVGTGFYILNAFMEPLCEANGWSRTQVNMALVIAMFLGYILQLFYGTFVAKVGPRIMMLIGPFFAGLMFIALGRVSALWQFYLVFALLYFGNGAYGGIVANTAVSNWFILKRGQAMGIATAAISLSGAIVPLAAMALLLAVGMQTTTLLIGLAVMLLGPTAWFVVRDWPETQGLLPDGLATSSSPETEEIEASNLLPDEFPDMEGYDWTIKQLVQVPAFWKVGICYIMAMTGVVGVMSQLKPRFADLGFEPMTAMYLMAATALLGAVGKYVWGMLCDRYDPRYVVAALFTGTGIGLVISLMKGSVLLVYAFVLVFGFSMGGIMSTYPIIVASLFGRKSFPNVLKYMMLFLIFQLGGPLAAGRSYDITGSYDTAYIAFTVLAFSGAGLMLTVKRPTPPT